MSRGTLRTPDARKPKTPDRFLLIWPEDIPDSRFLDLMDAVADLNRIPGVCWILLAGFCRNYRIFDCVVLLVLLTSGRWPSAR